LGPAQTEARLEPEEREIGEPLPAVEVGSALRQGQPEATHYRDNIPAILPQIETGVAVEKHRSLLYYQSTMGDKEARLRAVADDYDLTVDELRTLIDDWKATGRITQRGHMADAGADTRPEYEPIQPAASHSAAHADAIGRPRPGWKDHKDKMALPEFVAWAYAPERAAGTLSKAMLRGDFELYTDYFNWRRRRNLHTEEHWLRDLPTKKEWAAQQPDPSPTRLEEFDETTQEAVRRYQRVRQRGYRRVHSAG
jgi:hypothetical protein